MPKNTVARTRDAEASQQRILEAAREEFADKGLAGARVDTISEKADVNKRMIYHYFGGKEALFSRIVQDAYIDIRQAEQALKLDRYKPKEALEKLVRFTFNYYLDNPHFIPIINDENLSEATHLKKSNVVGQYNQQLVSMVSAIIDRGVKAGIFRNDIDPVQLNITIAAINYYYITNRHTGEVIYQRAFMSEKSIQERIDFNVKTILHLVLIDPNQHFISPLK